MSKTEEVSSRFSTTMNKPSVFEKIVPALLVITVGLAFMVGVLWQKVENIGTTGTSNVAGTQQAPAPVQIDIAQIKDLFNKDLIYFGDPDSDLIFVEASDPSCPYCHIAAGLNPSLNSQVGTQFTLVSDGGSYVAPVLEMKKLVDQGKAAFVWIYTNGHGNGELSTKALYCAHEKGKFWEAHDLLMTSEGYTIINDVVKNDVANAPKLVDFLKTANVPDLLSCLQSGKYDDRIASDSSIAASLGISGTPGFYVNENNFAGAYSFTDMQPLVDEILK